MKKLAGHVLLTLFLPYIMTVILSGSGQESELRKSGILVEYEEGKTMDAEEFLPYIIAAQIDSDGEMELLKVQAVIGRTNFMREAGNQKTVDAKNLSLAYVTPRTFEKNIGTERRKEILNRLEQAVAATALQTIKYEGEYIEALYHEISSGTTVSAKEIYGRARPYLTVVDSSQDVEAKEYMTMAAFTEKEVIGRLKNTGKGEKAEAGTIFSTIQITEKTENGYVKKVSAAGETLTGEEWQKLFGLPSRHFYLEEQDGALRMIAIGKGHGVGLSQYGAGVLAEQGWKYEEILKKYYPGVTIE